MTLKAVEVGSCSSRIDEVLGGIGAIEFLRNDPRPTFVLDLDELANDESYRTAIVYNHAALTLVPALVKNLRGVLKANGNGGNADGYTDFRSWVTSLAKLHRPADHEAPTHTYKGYSWTFFELKDRCRIVSGTPTRSRQGVSAAKSTSPQALSSEDCKAVPSCEVQTSSGLKVKTRRGRPSTRLKWLDTLPDSPHIQLFKDTDWTATLLGPIESWPARLVQMVRLVLSDSRAASIVW